MAEEKRLENRVKEYLEDHGCWQLKYWGGGQFTRSGVPDVLSCIGGRFVAIELKASHGTASDLQLVTLQKIEDAGGIAFLMYPQDWDEFEEVVEKLRSAEIDGSLLTPDRKSHKMVDRWHTELERRGYGRSNQKRDHGDAQEDEA